MGVKGRNLSVRKQFWGQMLLQHFIFDGPEVQRGPRTSLLPSHMQCPVRFFFLVLLFFPVRLFVTNIPIFSLWELS